MIGSAHESAGASRDVFPIDSELVFERWPDELEGRAEVQFRLIYQGRLPAASAADPRRKEKHEIRRVLHRQLLELWKVHPFFKRFAEGHLEKEMSEGSKQRVSVMYEMANDFNRCGYRFLPLVRNSSGVACSLDILFLRRDAPGDLIRNAGDIDNRIKVLFDALRMPADCSEVRGVSPSGDEDPFLCLLEDDRLITELKVTTDRLLTPLVSGDSISHVHLIIQVKTLVLNEDTAWSVFR